MIMAKNNANTHALKLLALMVFMTNMMSSNLVNAASREPAAGGNAKIVGKLQAMVTDITSQRDALKTENDKIKAEAETLKKDLEKLQAETKTVKTEALAAEQKLQGELSTQKSGYEELHTRLDTTTAKLHEVIEKYNVLTKSKNELSVVQNNLQTTQKMTAAELSACEHKNLKMYQVTKDLMTHYKQAQNKGVFDTLLDSEPVFQINDVEFETILQDYEDKLNKQKYTKNLTVNEAGH